MLTSAILLAIWAGIAGVDMYNGFTHIHRPLVSGVVVGLILGDLKTGLLAGAIIELAFMGLVPLGGAQPPNVVIGGIIGTSFAILAHQDPKLSVVVAVPFAVAMQLLITMLFTVFSFLIHKADAYADKADTRGIANLNYYGLLGLFTLYFIAAFLPIYFGAGPAKSVIQSVPHWIIGGLSVAGGVMPAIGFAMLLKIMLKRDYIAYFCVGFIIATYAKLPILAIVLVGVSLAAMDYFMRKNILQAVKESNISVTRNNDEDGI